MLGARSDLGWWIGLEPPHCVIVCRVNDIFSLEIHLVCLFSLIGFGVSQDEEEWGYSGE